MYSSQIAASSSFLNSSYSGIDFGICTNNNCHCAVTVVFQLCCSCVSVVFQLCCSGVSVVFHWCFSCVSLVFQCCFDVTVVFQSCFSCVAVVFQSCFSGVTKKTATKETKLPSLGTSCECATCTAYA